MMHAKFPKVLVLVYMKLQRQELTKILYRFQRFVF
jgi:hypothetical protein